ncbi:MAG: hypothetical protein QOC95_1782, partial [Thermoleophilaceae bacterium]|nr:hypothetical protein [Thermoleophilaceae bacterium]
APDSLTSLTHGASWVDQQWLSQVAFYGVVKAGGLKLAMLVHFVIIVGSYAAAAWVGRRRGAGALAIAWVGVLAILVAPWGWQLRTQNLAYPLFVLLFALLLREREGATNRAFLAIPLLILWANLHGSVLMGVLVVLIYAGTSAVAGVRRRDGREPLVRCGLLALGAVASVFASPYSFSLVHYYKSLLGNSDIKLIMEWRPASEFAGQAIFFFILVGITALVLIRYRKRLTTFQIATLIITALAGFQAVRNIIWFDYVALMVIPMALSQAKIFRPREGRLPTRLFPILAVALGITVFATAVGRSDGWYQHGWDARAASQVAAVVHAHPQTRIWANEIFADWLLWKEPTLAGHVAYDARFEILPHRYFKQVALFSVASGKDWHRFVDGYDVLVLGTRANSKQIAAMRKETGRKVVFRDDRVTVLGRSATR